MCGQSESTQSSRVPCLWPVRLAQPSCRVESTTRFRRVALKLGDTPTQPAQPPASATITSVQPAKPGAGIRHSTTFRSSRQPSRKVHSVSRVRLGRRCMAAICFPTWRSPITSNGVDTIQPMTVQVARVTTTLVPRASPRAARVSTTMKWYRRPTRDTSTCSALHRMSFWGAGLVRRSQRRLNNGEPCSFRRWTSARVTTFSGQLVMPSVAKCVSWSYF